MSHHATTSDERACQVHSVPRMGIPSREPVGDGSLRTRLRLTLKRTLGARAKRRLKTLFDSWMQKLPASKRTAGADASSQTAAIPLKAGDLVRVRAREEIEPMLDSWNEMKGCGFMEDMWPYCGTIQRVFKQVERFVDERDYRVHKVQGLVLLQDAICQGTKLYGKCDRSCFFFWREEWLEKIEAA